eukprot:2716861-Rhodomonas_salina.1
MPSAVTSKLFGHPSRRTPYHACQEPKGARRLSDPAINIAMAGQTICGHSQGSGSLRSLGEGPFVPTRALLGIQGRWNAVPGACTKLIQP